MNQINICGRLTRDPEERNGNGTTIARYTVAVDRKFKQDGKPDADFFNCIAFGKPAEFASKYFRQGTKVIVSGRMEQDNYTDKNGNKVYAWQLIVNDQEFAESKKAAEENGSVKPANDSGDQYLDIADGIVEDLPFI